MVRWLSLCVAALMLSAGGSSLLAASPAAGPLARAMSLLTLNADEETKTVKLEGITLKTPANWKQQPPSNRLRLAQFVIPAAEGDKEPGELVVSFFQGDGGGVDPNLKRWNEQYTGDERKIKLAKGTSPQGSYYWSDVSGTYLKSEGGGPFAPGKKTPMPGYRTLSVILQVPDEGNYFLRLTGPEKTVAAAAENFRKSFDAVADKESPYELK